MQRRLAAVARTSRGGGPSPLLIGPPPGTSPSLGITPPSTPRGSARGSRPSGSAGVGGSASAGSAVTEDGESPGGGMAGPKGNSKCPPLGAGITDVTSPLSARALSSRSRLVKGKTVLHRMGTRILPTPPVDGGSGRRGRMSIGTLSVDSNDETPSHKGPFRLADLGRRVASAAGRRRSGTGLGGSPGRLSSSGNGSRNSGVGAGTPAGAVGRGSLGGGESGDGSMPQRWASTAADMDIFGAERRDLASGTDGSGGAIDLDVAREGNGINDLDGTDNAALVTGKSAPEGIDGDGGAEGGDGADGDAPPRRVTDLAAEFDRREHTQRLEEDAAVDAAAAVGGMVSRKRLPGAPGAARVAPTVPFSSSVSSGGQPGGEDAVGGSTSTVSGPPIREELTRLPVGGVHPEDADESGEKAAAAAAAIRELIDRFESVELATTRAKEIEMQAAANLAAATAAVRGGGEADDADALAAGLADAQAAAEAASATAAAVEAVAAGTPVDAAAESLDVASLMAAGRGPSLEEQPPAPPPPLLPTATS